MFSISCLSFSWVNAQSATVGSYGSSILNFLKTLHIVMVAPIYILTNSAQKFPFLQPCQHLLFLVFLILDILTCEVIFHIVLFAFPWRLVMLSIFSCVCWPSVYLIWENVCLDIFPSCSWIILQLSCMNFKEFILDINVLSDMICKHFIPFSRLTFHFVNPFSVQKLSSLMQCYFKIFIYITFA